jgi:hypothetical protein
MLLQTARTKRVLILTARLVVVVLLAVSPRALLAPALSINRSVESKRPKSPKNIVRTNSVRIANAEKQGKEPKASREDLLLLALHHGPLHVVRACGLPPVAFSQLTKPDYLQSFRSALPQSQSSPPA